MRPKWTSYGCIKYAGWLLLSPTFFPNMSLRFVLFKYIRIEYIKKILIIKLKVLYFFFSFSSYHLFRVSISSFLYRFLLSWDNLKFVTSHDFHNINVVLLLNYTIAWLPQFATSVMWCWIYIFGILVESRRLMNEMKKKEVKKRENRDWKWSKWDINICCTNSKA
jgi:hypothetical protein